MEKMMKWVIHEYSKHDGHLDATMSYPKDCEYMYEQALSSQPKHLIKVGMGLIDVKNVAYENKLKTGRFFLGKKELLKWAE